MMQTESWSPWKVHSSLPPPMRRVEALRQQVAVFDLLGTTLPPEVRRVLRHFESELATELDGENDNGRAA